MQYSGPERQRTAESNEQAKRQLASLLSTKSAVLMAGAGSSKFAGYPLWEELVEELREELTPTLPFPENKGPTVCAGLVKDQLRKEGRLKEYERFLERRFQPRANNNHTEFHCNLVRLGFAGIVTTNYDIVLETAVVEAFSEGGLWRCDPIDLCEPNREYRAGGFLHSLSQSGDHRRVLHLHGCYLNPEHVILTKGDYLDHYGKPRDELGRTSRVLGKIHKKVLWSLLTGCHLVFVGFGMKDDFFMTTLDVVREDFALCSERWHFALMEFTSDDDRLRTESALGQRCVQPVFYHVPKKAPGESPDHSGLERLVLELANLLNVPTGSPSIRSLTKKMLEL